MRTKLSRFEERMMLLTSAAALTGFGLSKRRPRWAGVVLFGMSGMLLRASLDWLRPRVRLETSSTAASDIVVESSEESFPASDAPAWAMGVR